MEHMTITRMEHAGIVVDELAAATAFFVEARGVDLVGELERYEDRYRLCYVRGPEGIIVELAERSADGPLVALTRPAECPRCPGRIP